MERFTSIMKVMQGKNKMNLHWLYNTKAVDEPPLIFEYEELKCNFSGTSYRTSEKLLLNVSIPSSLTEIHPKDCNVAVETYLLHLL